jgi:hypothetical protein
MDYPKVLVACPTNSMKKYAMRRWIDNAKSFDYPNYEIYVVDNSNNDTFISNYADEIPVKHIRTDQQLPMQRVTQSMEEIRIKAIREEFDYWFNLEIDVIPLEKDVIYKMVKLAQATDVDLVNHAYPARWVGDVEHQGIGFSLLNRRLFEVISFATAGNVSPDGFMWGKIRKHTGFRMIDAWNLFPVKHLAND